MPSVEERSIQLMSLRGSSPAEAAIVDRKMCCGSADSINRHSLAFEVTNRTYTLCSKQLVAAKVDAQQSNPSTACVRVGNYLSDRQEINIGWKSTIIPSSIYLEILNFCKALLLQQFLSYPLRRGTDSWRRTEANSGCLWWWFCSSQPRVICA